MNTLNTAIEKKHWFFEIMLFLFLLHSVPIIGWFTPAIVFMAIVALLYISTISFIGSYLFFQYFIKTLPISIIIFLGFILKIVPFQASLFVDIYTYLQIVIYFIIGQHVLNTNSYKLAKRLVVLLIIIHVVTSITTYIGCLINPTVSRFLATTNASNDAEYGSFMLMNIGGFEFIYTLVLFVPILIGCIKNKIGNRLLLIIIIIIFAITVIETQYTMAILFFFIALILFFAPSNFNKTKAKNYIIIIVLALYLGRLLLPPVFLFLADNSDSALVANRFEDIAYILQGKSLDTNSDAGARMELYQQSLHIFLSNPIVGCWNERAIGGHSFLFDKLALFGILGVLGYLLIWKGVIKLYLKKQGAREWIGYFYFIIIEAIGLSVLNPKMFYVFLGFIMPLFLVIFNNKKEA